MSQSETFTVKKAFNTIDELKEGYIHKRNLKSFLRKHNYIASSAACMAIIR